MGTKVVENAMVLIVADNMVVGEAEVVNMAVMVVAEGE
jgi:hypothetical protein